MSVKIFSPTHFMKNITELRKELKTNSSTDWQNRTQRFFKEKIKLYGLKSSEVSKISRKYFNEIETLPKKEIFDMCEELFKSDVQEEAMVAADWSYRLRFKYELKDIYIFEKWIEKYINNWAKCDIFCNHSVGSLIEKYPQLVKNLKTWAKSKNLWVRRASAVSLIAPARKGLFLKDIFEICDLLLVDKEDMVQKGYGWLLKVSSEKHQKEVFDYVLSNKDKMPRTSLRYAIEKMSQKMKSQAMKS